jgi:glutamate dehydrogenase
MMSSTAKTLLRAGVQTANQQTEPQPAQTMTGENVAIRLDRQGIEADDRARVTVEAAEPVTLRRILPLLESLDIEALDEHTTTVERADGSTRFSYEFTVKAERFAHEGTLSGSIAEPVESAFNAMWRGLTDADDFNALILAAGLTWQQVAVLRALSRYLGQTRLPYDQSRIQQILLDNTQAASALIDLFEARFGVPVPGADDPARHVRINNAQTALDDVIRQVVSLDADRVLRAYHVLINATVRTNAFVSDTLSETRPWLAFKLRPHGIDELPEPRPMFEIFVYSPTVEGIHMRFGTVSRGGVRWSDRVDDYRTEVLGLAKAQAVKNAVIVPAGAKGVFVPKPLPEHAPGRRRKSADGDDAAGIAGYRQFISGLLDLTDNRTSEFSTTSPPSVVSYDSPDPYLVVAADKGTARFSDTANEIARQRGFWLGDAFASGGATGYDHKVLGITARGAWISAAQHLHERGIDVGRDTFTAVGIGDMSGDVFGNGMMISDNLGLIAAFDHRHIFCDPNPDRATAFAERQRLFALSGSSWDRYDRSLISDGGGVWARDSKRIPVSTELRAALGLSEETTALTPAALIRAILCAPVDLLWNGGIGTYIKAGNEQHLDVGDKFNDAVRVDAGDVRARVVAEGGNLGVSPRGRIEYARKGGQINSDAIDNAAGVDCSDHEVNIKILLNRVADQLTTTERTDLLASMTNAVSELVLANNRDHNYILSAARHEAARMAAVHADMVTDLENRRGLARNRENLPTTDEFAHLVSQGAGLSSPQLATLLGHVKLDLKESLRDDGIFDDPHFQTILRDYFPGAVRERFPAAIDGHPLRRDIISTVVVNKLFATGGLTYAHRLTDDTGATSTDVVRAFCVASDMFSIPNLIAQIQGAGLPSALTNELTIEVRRLLDRASRWLLSHRPQPLDIATESDRFASNIRGLGPRVGALLQGSEAHTLAESIAEYQRNAVPPATARLVGESLYVFSLLDIAEAAHTDDELDASTVAALYFALSDHLGIDDLLLAVSSLPRGDRWHAQARLALREDLYRSLKSLTLDVAFKSAGNNGAPWQKIQTWESLNQSRLQRSRRALDDMHANAPHNLAALSVAATHVRRMATISR